LYWLQVDNLTQLYRTIRSDITTVAATIYNQAVHLAEEVGVEPIHPRCAGRQQHRNNAPSTTVQEYYLRNLTIPFVDSILTEIESQFSGMHVYLKVSMTVKASIIDSVCIYIFVPAIC
jgi:hypothetical protein